MGSIFERRRKDGTSSYMAQVSIFREGKSIHRESRTFERGQAATAWVKKREAELAKPGAVMGIKQAGKNPTLAMAIDRYILESRRAIGRTKAQVLASIKEHDIAERACAEITSKDIAEFAGALATKVQPQTVANYLSHLAAVFAIARPAWGYPLDERAMGDAFKVSRRLGIAGKSRERNRRPSIVEMDALMAHFQDRGKRRPGGTPMATLIAFALFSTRRQEEITRIRWDDLDIEGSRILVRDMKNPGDKAGNDIWCDLPQPALRIALAIPRKAEAIFPFNGSTISAAFTRACQLLDIEDLHFHDLRHEGVSRLFEMGLNIPHVAAASGHRSWTSLKRYTHIRQSGDKWEGWGGIEIAIETAGKAPAGRPKTTRPRSR